MGTVPCSIAGCRNPSRTRTWCHAHYRRWRKTGDPQGDVELRSFGETPEKRFWQKVDRDGPVPARRPDLGPCYLWTSGLNSSGYGVFNLGGEMVGAHHAGWLMGGGEPIAAGLVLDHRCEVRRCVRRTHLEPVTQQVNSSRNLREMCVNGHAYDEANTYRDPKGRRKCRRCARERQKVHRDRMLPIGDNRSASLVYDDELARRVAAAYREALNVGEPPVVAVARRLGQTYSNANRLCRFARERGALAAAPRAVVSALRATPRRALPSGEVVYFVERDGFIKIGTTTNLSSRLGTLAREILRVEGMAQGPVTLLATLPGGRTEERNLHRRFAHLRAGGEWFRPDDDLLAVIRALAAGAIPELAVAG